MANSTSPIAEESHLLLELRASAVMVSQWAALKPRTSWLTTASWPWQEFEVILKSQHPEKSPDIYAWPRLKSPNRCLEILPGDAEKPPEVWFFRKKFSGDCGGVRTWRTTFVLTWVRKPKMEGEVANVHFTNRVEKSDRKKSSILEISLISDVGLISEKDEHTCFTLTSLIKITFFSLNTRFILQN